MDTETQVEENSRKGGLRTMPFIIVNESFERVASYGLQTNMIIYLMKYYHMSAATGTSILGIWTALSNGLAIVGAIISDSYLGRFKAVAFGSISTLISTAVGIIVKEYWFRAVAFGSISILIVSYAISQFQQDKFLLQY
ncbi:protein NRT1/ PTR FAMILY 1.1 [Capsicum annuum]|uniref:protein NRT1/ PTR FAMILY 1.1 n=1 Tax=Capsicum annuum TaxID=4072 RepID=UPI001FB04C76|nr:protein NRT1/ PTR FAMILY 1.1 [Capsicum annuum]